tara:strand:+ start:64616 stop:68131 length:3516 start_codon:yes stop_codon:yes gene_type:complete
MKYISSFYNISENVSAAKSLLKKLELGLDNPDYLKIRKLIQGNDGYAFWFTKLHFVDKQPFEELENIWDIIKDKNGLITYFSKKIVDLESVEDFWDEVNLSRTRMSAKKIVNKFPSHQKRLFDLTDNDDLELLSQLSKNKSLESLIKKISSFKDKKSLVDAATRLLNTKLSGSFGKLVDQIEETGAKIKHADQDNNIIICQVNYPQLKSLGGDTSWCIVNSESTFNSYSNGGFQWIIFFTDLSASDVNSKIGVTTGEGYRTAHNKRDGYISELALESILLKRGYELEKLNISRELLLDMDDWSNISVKTLLFRKFNKEEIIKRKKVFKNASSYRYRQTETKNDLSYFNEKEITKWDLLSRTELDWNQIQKFSKEFIIDKKCIDRLNYKQTLSTIMHTLKFTSDDVINHKIFKMAVVDNSSIDHFTKEELINNDILKHAAQIKMGELILKGFEREEIFKNYSNILDSQTKNIIEHFGKDATKKKVISVLGKHKWSDDWEKLGVSSNDDGAKGVWSLDVMSLYQIDVNDIQLKPLATRRTIKKSIQDAIDGKLHSLASLKILYKMGYKITDKESLYIFFSLFNISVDDNYNLFNAFSTLINFNQKLKKVDSEASKIIDNLIESKLDGVLVHINKPRYATDEEWEAISPERKKDLKIKVDYKSYFRQKQLIGTTEVFRRLKSKIKEYFLIKLENFRTKEDKSNYNSDISIDLTIEFLNEFKVTKKDFEDNNHTSIDICKLIFRDSLSDYGSDDKIKLIFYYFVKLGFHLTDDDKIKMIGIILKDSHDRYMDADKESRTYYTEKYYKRLLSFGLDQDRCYKGILSHMKGKIKISTYDKEYYEKLFKDTKYKEITSRLIENIELRESEFSLLSSLKDSIDGNRQYNNSTMSIDEWYDTHFETYANGLSIRNDNNKGYTRREEDLRVLMILTKLNKLGRLSSEPTIDYEMDGHYESFDENLLHTLAKIITRSGRERYKKLEFDDTNLRNLYNWTIRRVDESNSNVQKMLSVCYYIHDKDKYQKFVDNLINVKSNVSYWGYGENRESVTKYRKNRLNDARYILSYLATMEKYDEFEALVKKVFSWMEKGTQRGLKMTRREFKESIGILERISVDTQREMGEDIDIRKISQDFRSVRDLLVKEITELYPVMTRKNRRSSTNESFVMRRSTHKQYIQKNN